MKQQVSERLPVSVLVAVVAVSAATGAVAAGEEKWEFEAAVVVTNDSDLKEPVRIVRRELGCPVGIVNPHRQASRVLAKEASFVKRIRQGVLKASQFPPTLRDRKGTITKPKAW